MPKPVTIKGAEKLMRTLRTLSKTGGKRALRKATAAAGTVLKKGIMQEVPVHDGLLRKAQDVKVAGRGYRISAIVGANVGKLQADNQADATRPTNIDFLVNEGHVTPDGSLVAPNAYLERGSTAAMPAAEARFIDKLSEEITREAMK